MLKIQLVPKQVIKFNRATMEQNSTRCLREKKAKVDSSAICNTTNHGRSAAKYV